MAAADGEPRLGRRHYQVLKNCGRVLEDERSTAAETQNSHATVMGLLYEPYAEVERDIIDSGITVSYCRIVRRMQVEARGTGEEDAFVYILDYGLRTAINRCDPLKPTTTMMREMHRNLRLGRLTGGPEMAELAVKYEDTLTQVSRLYQDEEEASDGTSVSTPAQWGAERELREGHAYADVLLWGKVYALGEPRPTGALVTLELCRRLSSGASWAQYVSLGMVVLQLKRFVEERLGIEYFAGMRESYVASEASRSEEGTMAWTANQLCEVAQYFVDWYPKYEVTARSTGAIVVGQLLERYRTDRSSIERSRVKFREYSHMQGYLVGTGHAAVLDAFEELSAGDRNALSVGHQLSDSESDDGPDE